MDAKEAIEYFQFVVKMGEFYCPSEPLNAYKLAVEALEKVPTLEAENARLRERETPKKPTKDGRCYKCTCDYPLYSGKAFANREKFCSRCGQAIDWSSDKNVKE